MSLREHACKSDIPSTNPSWWMNDGRGIPLCRVCDNCIEEKKKRYRPEILSHYDENDIDEYIEDDY